MQSNAAFFSDQASVAFPQIATKPQVAEWLGVSIQTVENWCHAGHLPPPMKLGKGRSVPFWFMSELVEWIGRQRPSAPVPDEPQKEAA